jgi:CheY-like chemotaxis protein
LLAGKKLLLADDSLAVQKVIDLTFTDEGMQVTTVSDGQRALEQLEQVAPDVVLADVFMPGVGGYELCEFIKQSERFRNVPVMLLVGSFEPFDEAEARRAGADDVVTKPFQSIRELISRVGSLLGGQKSEGEPAAHEYSTLGLGQAEASTQPLDQPQGTNVFVEAASMDEESASLHASEATTGPIATTTPSGLPAWGPRPAPGSDTGDEPAHMPQATCSTDIELQTADTQQLKPIEVEPAGPAAEPTRSSQEDTIEIEPVMVSPASDGETAEISSIGAPGMNEQLSAQIATPSATDVLNDSLLDLGTDLKPSAVDEDFFLDLDLEEPVRETTAAPEAYVSEPAVEGETVAAVEVPETSPAPSYEYEAVAESQQWTIIPEPPPAEVAPPVAIEAQSAVPAEVSPGLSAAAIDAIARRVVEQLSDKVVREIAWEVVPELAELLIKQKLEEKK